MNEKGPTYLNKPLHLTGKMNMIKNQQFSMIHNYIDTESMILRKGAVSANKGEN
jgi:hypothetical protein